MATVKLKIRRTSEEGFLVILTATHRDVEAEGFLPPLPPELESSFKQWQSAYRQIEAVRSCVAPAPGLRLTPKSVTICSNSEHTDSVKTHLNQWLNSGDSRWQPIRDRLIAIVNQQTNDEIRVILDAKDINLRRLPWHEWSLFAEHCPDAEVALSLPRSSETKEFFPLPNSSKVRILVAVGRSDGINTKDDLEVIQNLEKLGADVVCLMQPSLKQLCEAMWDEIGYHIFVFTGHSGSREDGQIGWIEVNEEESLSIEQFKEAIKEAIARGLQLAIFNSCDGLGLASQLSELNLPQCIVMREPVPDSVAVEFLKHFFQEFTRNNSLFAAMQRTRKRLEHFQSVYPGAIWLPAICLGSNVEPLTWQKLCQPSPRLSEQRRTRNVLSLSGLSNVLVVAGFAFFVIFVFISPIYFSFSSSKSPEQSNNSLSRSATVPSFESVEVPSGTWLYGGSTAWARIREQVDQQIEKKLPTFNLTLTQHPTLPLGSGTGIKMLLAGQLSFSQSSRPISDSEYEIAASRGVKLKQVAVAYDGIAIVVNPSLKIEGLTLEQIKGIYSGKITNWSQVGGADLDITPYTSPKGSGGTDFLKEEILESEDFGKNVVQVRTPSEALNKVSQSGGIYFASASNLVGQCSVKPLAIARTSGGKFVPPYKGKLVPWETCPTRRNKLNIEAIRNGEYPLYRRLFVVIKQDGQIDERVGEAYARLLLTDEGQRLIQEAGYIPLRSF